MILYGNTAWTSPYVLSCFVTLRVKGIPFDMKTIPLDGTQHAPEYARASLTSRVPLLVDGDFALSESSAIVEYLEEVYPPPGRPAALPPDRRARARARQIMAWIRSDFMPIREERSSHWVFYSHDRVPPYEPLSGSAEASIRKLLAAAERLIPADAGPLFGDWCVADTDLAMMLQRLNKTGFPLPQRIRDYAERQWDLPAVREFCGQKRPRFTG